MRKEESVSEITLDLRLVFTIPKTGLTINGLIQGLKESSSKIHETILTTLMQALEEQVIETILQKDPQRFKRNGHQNKPRCLKCSFGKISYRLAQLIDLKTRKTFQPLRKALAIPSHDHYLEEALESSMGLAMHVSYRRSVNEAERIQGQSPAHTTLHARLQEFAQNHEPFGNLKNKPFRYLLVDGTKVHLQGYRGKDLGQVEMRWALASLGSFSPFEPVGFWIDTDWKTIRKDLNQRVDYKKLQFLFSDGGPGILESLLASWMKPQRCLWHGKREFPYLLYADGAKKRKQKPFLEKMQSIPVFHFTQAHLEQLRPQDRPQIAQITQQTQKGFEELLEALDPEKYPRARAYIENLMKPVTTFLSWWLKKGEILPLTTNALESAFSQVNNRIKRVGRRWSEQGLLNWLKLTFYKVFQSDLWNQIWNHRKKRLPKIRLISIQASFAWTNTIT
jgi:hypothetical protein